MSDIYEATWWGRLGLAIDRVLNVLLFDGADTETVSLHAAEAEEKNARWACWTCWVLGVLVQRHHCAITLDPNAQETRGAAIRAGLVMLAGFVAAGVGVHYLLAWIGW